MRLYTKILLSCALASVFAGQGIIVYSRRAVSEALLAHIEGAALGEVRKSEGALAEAMISGDESSILPLLQAGMKATGAVYASALDGDGRVLGHSNVAEVGKIYRDPYTASSLTLERPSSRVIEERKMPVLELAVPILYGLEQAAEEDFLLQDSKGTKRGARVGHVRFGLPIREALATVGHISARILRVVLLLGGAAALILFFLMRRFLAPIGLLEAATAKIRGGDYRGVVPVTTNDEIGALARSFNEMSRELGRTTVSKDFFNDILDSIQDQVIVTDAAGLIVLVNPAVVRLLGWTKEELIGLPAAALLDGPGASFLAPSQNVAAQLVGKSRETVSVLFSSSAITDADGRVSGYIGAAKDVRDMRRLEARMHQSEKLSAVGQLAAGVAHEINNPLGVILGFAQGMACRLKEGDELELPIKSIEREALRCKALVQNLLTFARTSRSERTATDVNSVVEQALSLIAPQAKISRVAVATALAEGLPPVLGNKNQLEQVIMNLAKNAIDAMSGGGALSLSTELLEQAPHSWVCLSCADDGAGIAPAVLAKIFDPFFTTKPIGQGTGLGLSLVSEIVKKHSGEIAVESRPGRTVFTVKLPVRTGRENDRRVETETKGTISHG